MCADCDRELTARLFTVTCVATGAVRVVGARCAAKATGFKVNALEREIRRVARMAETARRRAVLAAEYGATIDPAVGSVFTEAVVWDEMWDADCGYRRYLTQMGV